ncbi:hypothetical protein [Lysobacter fragariae]
MYPVKNHRVVRQSAALAGGNRDRGAIEAAENEGWPLPCAHAALVLNRHVNGNMPIKLSRRHSYPR